MKSTKKQILEGAMNIASEHGLKGLTIGRLAQELGLSKSGVFGHFKSKEKLQIDTIRMTEDKFIDHVFTPSLKATRGLPRLLSISHKWYQWVSEELPGGCPLIGASMEFDDDHGPVRDFVIQTFNNLTNMIHRAAVICTEEGHFKKDLNCNQFVYDFIANLYAYQCYSRLLQKQAASQMAERNFNELIKRSSV